MIKKLTNVHAVRTHMQKALFCHTKPRVVTISTKEVTLVSFTDFNLKIKILSTRLYFNLKIKISTYLF